MGVRTILDKETRRQQLLEAAIKVFASKGYKASAISDIIAEAGVARGTFYLYYRSKADVFRAVLDAYMEQLDILVKRELTREYTFSSLRETMRESLLDFLRFFAENRDLATVVFREAMTVDPEFQDKCLEAVSAMHGHWREAIIGLQQLGFVRSDLDPDFLNACYTGMFTQLVLMYIIPDPKPDLDMLAEQWISFSEKGALSQEVAE